MSGTDKTAQTSQTKRRGTAGEQEPFFAKQKRFSVRENRGGCLLPDKKDYFCRHLDITNQKERGSGRTGAVFCEAKTDYHKRKSEVYVCCQIKKTTFVVAQISQIKRRGAAGEQEPFFAKQNRIAIRAIRGGCLLPNKIGLLS